jgi:tetratricopeptide (TPR) repeat protein
MTAKASAPAGAEVEHVPAGTAPEDARRDETSCAALNGKAQFAIDTGDLDKAEVILAEAERSQALALQLHALDTAKTLALRGGIALARQRFGEAAESFAAAAEILPAGHDDERFAYLNAEADAFYRQGNDCRGTEAFELAITRYRHLALVRPRCDFPHDWAMTQMRLGAALQTLGECEGGAELLKDAADAYRSALQEFTRTSAPQLWALTQMSLGTALFRIGEKEAGTERLNEAVAAYRNALKEYSYERAPLDWARTQMNLGAALEALGGREEGTARLFDAIAAYREALKGNTKGRAPALWAMTQFSLGNALLRLGEQADNISMLREAAATFGEGLQEQSRERTPIQWAAGQICFANALFALGTRESGTTELEEANCAYGKALEVYNRERAPLQWAAIAANQGVALSQIAERQKDVEMAQLAISRIEAAIAEFRDGKDLHAAANYEARLVKAHDLAAALAKDGVSLTPRQASA